MTMPGDERAAGRNDVPALVVCGCGGMPAIWQYKNDPPDGFWVECDTCCHQTTMHTDDRTAAAAWNIAMRGLASEHVALEDRLANIERRLRNLDGETP